MGIETDQAVLNLQNEKWIPCVFVNEHTIIISNKGPNTDQLIVEDKHGFRYKRNLTLEGAFNASWSYILTRL